MIRVLDEKTIDKIAAGEVVERPASVVKELMENAIDAGADRISVEIKNGGIDMIRVTDNGSGIERNEVRKAFLPHATSKLISIEDLFTLKSLGFRGEALSSIASVTRVELLTKRSEEILGIRYVIEGGTEVSFDEAGIPDGTTFIIRDLFYNTPARRKFLKSAHTEAGYITSLVEEMAMDRPDIAFKYSVNGSNRLVTSGNGELKEVIYRIYGRDISDNLIPVDASEGDLSLKGFIAKPLIARNSRAMENYFVNSRYIKDDIISKAIEDGYSGHLMQHRFPFTALFLTLSPGDIDINVHPRKMEIKFSDGPGVYSFLRNAVSNVLSEREFINDFSFEKEEKVAAPPLAPEKAPEPFEHIAIMREERVYAPETDEDSEIPEKSAVSEIHEIPEKPVNPKNPENFENPEKPATYLESGDKTPGDNTVDEVNIPSVGTDVLYSDVAGDEKSGQDDDFSDGISGSQMDLFEERILSKDAYSEYRIAGQIFDTYWIIEYRDEMLLLDQHAAHEKVNYERFMEEFKNKEITSQNLNPPVIITLSGKEREVLERFLDRFLEMGFEIEPFGGNDFALRTVPYNLYGLKERDIMTALLDELSSGVRDEDISVIHDKIASMSCKAAIKGNSRLSLDEAQELLRQLLSLKDPYNCPHGRPTIIKMSKRELEKKFKRII